MKTQNNRRFAFGMFDGRHSSIWRLWSQKNDVYVAARSIAGDIKTSLHESGKCQTSFTSQFMKSDHTVRTQVPDHRHIVTWERQRIQNGLFRLFDIIIPHERMKCVPLQSSQVSKVDWLSINETFLNTQISFFLSNIDLGSDKWIGKKSMGTNLLHKGVIQGGKTLYVVYYEHNEPLGLHDIQVEDKSFEENGEYRMLHMRIDQTSKVGYVIDSSADKVVAQT